MNDTASVDVFKKPFLHFDAFGPLPRVLQAVEAHVPDIFPKEAPNFIHHLKELIEKYAREHGWEQIAVSLSKGLARAELDELIEKETPHTGPLIVDPTAHSPEHHVFTNASLLSARKERLVALNESTNDILIIIYGIESTDVHIQRALLMKRMRILGLSAEHASEELETGLVALKAAASPRFALSQKHAARLRRAREHLKDAQKKMGMGSEALADLDNEDASANLFIALATLQALWQETGDPELRATLNSISAQILSIPTHYENAGISFINYENMASQLIEIRQTSLLAPDVRADGDAHMENRTGLRPTAAPR